MTPLPCLFTLRDRNVTSGGIPGPLLLACSIRIYNGLVVMPQIEKYVIRAVPYCYLYGVSFPV